MIPVRFARRDQVQLIYEFIGMLAEYERKTDEVTVTQRDIENYIFDQKLAEVIFAYWEGKEVGFAIFYPRFSTFAGRPGLYIEDLFVLPPYRSRGVGKALMSFIAGQSLSRGGDSMEFSVLKWNKKAINFYHRLEAKKKESWQNYRISGNALNKLSAMQ